MMEPPVPPSPTLTEADLPSLVKQLEDKSRHERLKALERLSVSTISSGALSIADLVLDLFEQDTNPDVRIKAGEVLHYKLPPTPQAAKALFAALHEANDVIRHSVTFLLPMDTRPYVPELVAAMKSADPIVRKYVIGMCHLPNDSVITQALALALSDSDGQVRARAAKALGRFEKHLPNDAAIMQALVLALSDSDREVRAYAAQSLSRFDRANLAESSLISALRDPDRSVAFAAAKALRSMGDGYTEANRVFDEHVQAALSDADRNVRFQALIELTHSPFVDVKYSKRVRELLNTDLGQTAVQVIAKIRPAADEIPHLKRVLLSKWCVVEIARALAALGSNDPEIFDWLTRQLLESYPYNHNQALAYAKALACFGKEGVPYLIKALAGDDEFFPGAAVSELSSLGNDAIAAIPDLLRIVSDGGAQPFLALGGCCGGSDLHGRSAVLDALAQIAPDDERVLDCLGALAADNHDARKDAAIAALKTIGKCPETAG